MTNPTSMKVANGDKPTPTSGSREMATLLHLAEKTPKSKSSCHFEMGDGGGYNDCDLDRSSSGLEAGSHKMGHETNGTATNSEVASNIFVSFVGAGWLLVLPHAFSKSGWLLGTSCLAFVASINVYSMLLLVKCRKQLESDRHREIKGYGDLGREVMGAKGEILVNGCLLVVQVGFATAYLTFVADNIQRSISWDLGRAVIIYGCVPILSFLVQITDMKNLSPFSQIANVSNFVGLSCVILQDFEYYEYNDTIKTVELKGLIYVTSVCIFSLEGASLVLPLESSCANREGFPKLLKQVILGITLLMAFFATAGYIAYGEETVSPISLKLRGDNVVFVQMALCIAIYLTYPIMMFPVSGILESLILSDCNKPPRSYYPSMMFRLCIVMLTANIAYVIPDFRKLLQLVGASMCTLLGYTLPCIFHIKVFGPSKMKLWELMLDVCIIIFGVVFGLVGTLDAIFKILGDQDSFAEVSEATIKLTIVIGIFVVVSRIYDSSMKSLGAEEVAHAA